MRLAELIYEIARDSIEIDGGLDFNAFIGGAYDSDRDYSSQISFAFNYANLAFSRLLSEKKTKLKTEQAISDANGVISFGKGEAISIIDSKDRRYKRVSFTQEDSSIQVEKDYAQKPVYVEFRPKIPHFGINSIRNVVSNPTAQFPYSEKRIELSDYGITDEMCSYVKEYAKGGLLEYLSPDLSQKHIQMAENYFSQLKTQYTNFHQREIVDNGVFGGVFNG